MRNSIIEVAKSCNYGIIENYHSKLTPSEPTLGIVVDNGDSLLAVGANLLKAAIKLVPSEDFATLIQEAYIDTVDELDQPKQYRVIYFPSLMGA